MYKSSTFLIRFYWYIKLRSLSDQLTCRATDEEDLIFPEWSNAKRVPHVLETCRVVTVTSLREHSELRASPRNPNVSTLTKSEKSWSFDVWCFSAEEHQIYVGLERKALKLHYIWTFENIY